LGSAKWRVKSEEGNDSSSPLKPGKVRLEGGVGGGYHAEYHI
jgi:hypothetical protein